MSLSQRSEMRRCGQRWPTLEAAETSKRFLAGGQAVLECSYGCGGFHLEAEAKPAATRGKRPAAQETGPDRATRALVLARDGYQCARCGRPCGPGVGPYSLQHRKARGVGGDSSVPNLILLHGTATTGCHGEVEARQDPHDLAAGYRLESWQNPQAEGVMYFGEGGSGFTAWLMPDGSLSFEPPQREGAA